MAVSTLPCQVGHSEALGTWCLQRMQTQNPPPDTSQSTLMRWLKAELC